VFTALCALGFPACQDRDQLERLVDYLQEVERWADRAWRWCGPETAPPLTDGA